MQVWGYLKNDEGKAFAIKAKQLNMSEGELTQFLIRLFLNIPEGSYQPQNCINCQYYRIATSNVIQAFMKLNEAITLITPEYKRKF